MGGQSEEQRSIQPVQAQRRRQPAESEAAADEECAFGCILDIDIDIDERALDRLVRDLDDVSEGIKSFHAPLLGLCAGVAGLAKSGVAPVARLIDVWNFVDTQPELTPPPASAAGAIQLAAAGGVNGKGGEWGDLRGIEEMVRSIHETVRAFVDEHNIRLPGASAPARSRRPKEMAEEEGPVSPRIQVLKATAAEVNAMLVQRVVQVEGMDWGVPLVDEDGVKIWAAHVSEEMTTGWPAGVGPASGGGKLMATLARGEVDASVDQVCELFGDNDIVQEYNELCSEIVDVLTLDESTKITWGATKKMGPFSPRDFVTRCHDARLEGGTRLAVNMAESLPCEEERAAGHSRDYVRMEIVLGGTFVRPLKDGRAEYTVICLTNPGGAAQTSIGAALVNKLSVTAPLTHIRVGPPDRAIHVCHSLSCGCLPLPEMWLLATP